MLHRGIFQALAAVVLTVLCFVGTARAETRVSVDFFVEALAPYGDWVDHPRYGRVWYPHDVDHDWRPYTLGQWVWTEEHGWMWVSEEEWGWGPYHYGRWDHDESYGWIWIPDDVWGPAWVEWRSGEGYIGWAPLPPSARWTGERVVLDVHFDYLAPRFRPAWIFVADAHFVRPRVHSYCVPPARNITIIRKTVHITNYTVVNRVVVNKSVQVHHIERVTQARVPVVRVTHAAAPIYGKGPGGPARVGVGGTVSVFRPVVAVGGRPSLATGVSAAVIAARAKESVAKRPLRDPPDGRKTAGPGSPILPLPGKGVGVPPPGKDVAPLPGKGVPPPAKDGPPFGKGTPPPVKVLPPQPAKADDPHPRIKELQKRQEIEREMLRRQQEEERARKRFLEKPGVIRDQFRERSEQRRIQEQQRKVFEGRPKPPHVSSPHAPLPGKPVLRQPPPKPKKPPEGHDPLRGGQPPPK